MKRHRLTNEQKNYVARQLAFGLKCLGMPDDLVSLTMSVGSVQLPVDIGRRIARSPHYEETGEVGIEDVKRALAEWIAYKAGVRVDGGDNNTTTEE